MDRKRNEQDRSIERGRVLLARVRNKQLMLAKQGRVSESARYADRAQRLRAISKTAA